GGVLDAGNRLVVVELTRGLVTDRGCRGIPRFRLFFAGATRLRLGRRDIHRHIRKRTGHAERETVDSALALNHFATQTRRLAIDLLRLFSLTEIDIRGHADAEIAVADY